MTGPLYIAVDLGAGSGRVFLTGFDHEDLLFEEIHRFQYPPVEADGHLRWDFDHIFHETKHGLQKAGKRAKYLGRPVRSLGIDSWAVDYGLLDKQGKLLANPICYRDKRTEGGMERVFSVIPRSTVFERTGIQLLKFNTLFQLYSEGGNLDRAEKLLLLPDLINYRLTGNIAAEYTNATTTQMVNAGTGDWDVELLAELKLPLRLLPKIVPAGTDLGFIKGDIAEELQLVEVKVIAPATHDTASAIAAAPLADDWAYISSGTWSLIGIETDDAQINDNVAAQNFTNEGGVYGTFRFLKNVMGLWIFESCRKEWKAGGNDVEYEAILRAVSKKKHFEAFIFPDDERFLHPPSMLEAIAGQLRETGQAFNDDPAALSKIIFDSLAFRYASVLRTIESLTRRTLTGIQIVGGGGRNRYLNQMTSDASGLKVQAGLTEATAVGNALVQAIAAGRFPALADARRYVKEKFEFEDYYPRKSAELDEAMRHYAKIEAKFLD